MLILILAGGGGTRLWPLSREDFPKQFLHFGSSSSLLQKSVDRFLKAPFPTTVAVATNAQYAPLVKEQLKKIDSQDKVHIVIEPARKNTAPAIAFAIQTLQETLKLPDPSPVLILPSDHLLEPENLFFHALHQTESLVRKEHLILFGIKPTKPETGYGYIQIGTPFDSLTHFVKRFVEKPEKPLAEEYLASGNYYWNSGMFFLSIGLFWKKLAAYAPEIEQIIRKKGDFNTLPDISFDYAILEKNQDTLVCPLPISWSDVGSWDSVYEVMAKDQNQNVKWGNILDIDTKNCLIFGGKRLISTIGLEDLLIIETEEALFISKKGESQKVKKIVQELKKNQS